MGKLRVQVLVPKLSEVQAVHLQEGTWHVSHDTIVHSLLSDFPLAQTRYQINHCRQFLKYPSVWVMLSEGFVLGMVVGRDGNQTRY